MNVRQLLLCNIWVLYTYWPVTIIITRKMTWPGLILQNVVLLLEILFISLFIMTCCYDAVAAGDYPEL